MSNTTIKIGLKIGRWLIKDVAERVKGREAFLCECECKTERIVTKNSLSKSRSCGCLQRERAKQCSTKHGCHGIRTYNIWCNMKERCNNPNNKDYHYYGGRGIKVYELWEKDFKKFISDMGECPENMSIDRINNELGYYPDNCRWATQMTQCNNSRNNRYLTYRNETLTLSQWANITEINPSVLYNRLS